MLPHSTKEKKKVKIEPNCRQKRIPKRCIYLGTKWFMMVSVNENASHLKLFFESIKNYIKMGAGQKFKIESNYKD